MIEGEVAEAERWWRTIKAIPARRSALVRQVTRQPERQAAAGRPTIGSINAASTVA